MPESEVVNTVSSSTLTSVDTPVSAPSPESSASLKEQISTTSSNEKVVTNVSKNKSPQQKLDTRSSDEIRKQIESAERNGTPDGNAKVDSKEVLSEKTEEVDRSKWFDPEKGFKTAEDMKKSYAESQNRIRQLSEEKSRVELEQAQIKAEVEKIKAVQAQRTLTPEELQKQEAVSQWEAQNKEALDLIESKIAERLEARKSQEKIQEHNSSVEQAILKERNEWLDNFNKDPQRKQLWATMEQEFKEHGDTLESAAKNFIKNPLPFIEARAIQKSLPSIIEKAKAEAVEQYKASVKEAAEVERKTKFALPGGPKSGTGDVDISKLSSSEIGSLLQRNENG